MGSSVEIDGAYIFFSIWYAENVTYKFQREWALGLRLKEENSCEIMYV